MAKSNRQRNKDRNTQQKKNANSIPFSLNYNALKMFGRQLYSNAWAAISELVANGFDAGAKDVYLYINMIDKSHAIVELFDNGCGMDATDLKEKYTKIGRNRRIEDSVNKAAGRKGIGKLAALYLSDKYQIISKKDGETTAWEVNVTNMQDTKTPSMTKVLGNEVNIACSTIWSSKKFTSGTLIQLKEVNLTRLGDAAIDALKHKLSNYFLFDSLNSHLKICIIRTDGEKINFDRVEKKIAFNNMSTIYRSSNDIALATTNDAFIVPYVNKRKEDCKYTGIRKVIGFPQKVKNKDTGEETGFFGDIEFFNKKYKYALTGWIGIHSTIDSDSAKVNDARYVKNKFYNPNQIRVYVRNKLANENILGKLGLVATYANYIEGEISFEILDMDDLDDIATSNRQEFSVEDDRVKLLLALLKGISQQLLGERQNLADEINAEKNKIDEGIRATEKSVFRQGLREDLAEIDLPSSVADELATTTANKLVGDFGELKASFKLFISHASKDRIFTDFISHYLQFRGFRFDPKDSDSTDIFYSSDGLDITDPRPLADIIKRMLVNDNTGILFLTSDNFLASQYCLFEGGATWSHRSVLGYSIISLNYNSIPTFLTNGKSEFSFNTADKSSFEMNEQNYMHLITVLNIAIKHLNQNRLIRGDTPIVEISVPTFPDKVRLKLEGKTPQDYMDHDILEYWQTYVLDNIDNYLAGKHTP
ncbi:hypothetical protein FACS189485_12890 [Spirochaetia bacterium]|nr:hypothetical protein FACS189485_12890 [Spirochaetia bacterium]